jgi:membrane-associated protease RseP (regulator of RpoE activity)
VSEPVPHPVFGRASASPSELDQTLQAAHEPRRAGSRPWLHALLFLATLVTTTICGQGFYLSYLSDFGASRVALTSSDVLRGSLWYSVGALAILGAHEMGHYVACRYYGISATLPYFLPAPPVLIGTFGAVIRIRDPIPTKRMLFDIGIAGPIAGFVVAVPALILAVAWSKITRLPPAFEGINFGEPLLFQIVGNAFFGEVPDGYALNLHPLGFAAWFGLLATALNLLPVGQLDGGHIAYAVFGRKARMLTYLTLAAGLALGALVAWSWLSWCVIMAVLLWLTGWKHPRTLDERIPLDRRRLALAAFALVMLALCFTPIPIEPIDLIRTR